MGEERRQLTARERLDLGIDRWIDLPFDEFDANVRGELDHPELASARDEILRAAHGMWQERRDDPMTEIQAVAHLTGPL